MKNIRRILSFLLMLSMAAAMLSGLTLLGTAEEVEANLGAKYGVSMIMPGRTNKDNGIKELTDGKASTSSDDYWTLGRWTEDDIADENGKMISTPTPIAKSTCYVEADLGQSFELTAISAAFYVSSTRIYKWEAYASNDKDAPISQWTKIAEMTDDLPSIETGYKISLEKNVKARYVRLYGTYNSDNRDVHLCEFGVWGIDPDPDSKPVDPLIPPKFEVPKGSANLSKNSKIIKGNDLVNCTKELTDGLSGSSSDFYWSSGNCKSDPIENESNAWFEVDLGAVYDIDAIRVVPRLSDTGYYHWEVYATDDNQMAVEGWDLIAAKTTNEVSTAEGYGVELEESFSARYIRIYGTYSSYDQPFRLCEIEIWHYETRDIPSNEPKSVTVSPYDPENLKGFENWDSGKGKGKQTQLLICATEDIDISYTWEITLTGGGTSTTVKMKPTTKLDTWLYRFETCVQEQANRFVPVKGREYTVKVKIYDGETLKYESEAAGGFVCGDDPIVPGVEQTGDASTCAAMATAVFAIVTAAIFAVVRRKRERL